MRPRWSIVLVSLLVISLGLQTARGAIVLDFISSSMSIPASTAAEGSTSLAVGDWWTLTESTSRTATGSAAYTGDCIMRENGRITLTITALKGTMISLRSDYEATYYFTGNGIFVSNNQNCANYEAKNSVTLAVDLTNLRVTSVEPPSADANGLAGHVSWFMVDPSGLSSDAVTSSWVDPSSHYIDVQWTVTGPRAVTVRGQSVSAYGVTHSGQSSGFWKDTSSDIWSNGPAMDTRLYDASYGIYVGSSATGKFTFATSNGGWTETFSRIRHIADTNIRFPASNASATVVTLTEYSTTTQLQQVSTKFDTADLLVPILSVGIVVLSIIGALIYRHRTRSA